MSEELYRVQRGAMASNWMVIQDPPDMRILAFCHTEADATLIAAALNRYEAKAQNANVPRVHYIPAHRMVPVCGADSVYELPWTADPEAVSCKGCQATAAFRAALRGEPQPDGVRA